MNKAQIIELLPIMQAWADGKDVQYYSKVDKQWFTAQDVVSMNDWTLYEWRIKPEKQTGWINLYKGEGCIECSDHLYKSKDSAIKNARTAPWLIATIPVVFTEGEGL